MLPTIEVKVGELLVDAIVRIGFAKSKREARYFITHGAVRLGRFGRPENGLEESMRLSREKLAADFINKAAPPCDGAESQGANGSITPRPGDEFKRG